MYTASNIVFRAGSRTLLDGADLALAPGKVTVLIGPNGAGKSTLLKVLAGELRPLSGTVEIEGGDIARLKPARLARLRAVLPQSVQVAFPFTVAEVIAIGSMGGRGHEARIARALARVDLSDYAGRLYDRLSGGEAQRVQIARALVQLETGERPGYLLLDEPTASLDLAHQMMVVRLMREIANEGVGVLAVLHDLNLAMMAADEIVAMQHGRIAAKGAPDEVMTDEKVGAIYGVRARMSWAPDGPFLLPQACVGKGRAPTTVTPSWPFPDMHGEALGMDT